jgi:protein-disulfide isomerase
MTVNPSAKGVLALAVFSLLGFAIAGTWFSKSSGLQVGSTAIAAGMSQDEFERRVRDYLLAHPEVIGEAINRLEAKQGEADAAAAGAALNDHVAEVYHDPDSPVGGNPSGEVTLVEFFDYNCPYCRTMAPLMTQAEQADPNLRIVYKEFPILGAGSVFAAKAALAANNQGKYVAFHRALYQVHGQVDEAKVLEVAASVGLDVGRLKADMADNAIAAMIKKNEKLAQTLRISGTPGFIVGDQIATGATNFEGLQALIAKGRSSHQEAK